MTEPSVTEVTVNFNANGKVAIEGFGGESSGYGMSLSRKYTIPSDWTEDQVAEFEIAKTLELREQIEPMINAERDERYEARDWGTFK